MKHLRLLVLIVFCLPLFAEDAFMFRGDTMRSGAYQAAGAPKLHGVKWKFHTKGMVISSPTVAGDAVYVGSTDHMLYALDRSSGAVIGSYWQAHRLASSGSRLTATHGYPYGCSDQRRGVLRRPTTVP